MEHLPRPPSGAARLYLSGSQTMPQGPLQLTQ
jgi:hypothetical protein